MCITSQVGASVRAFRTRMGGTQTKAAKDGDAFEAGNPDVVSHSSSASTVATGLELEARFASSIDTPATESRMAQSIMWAAGAFKKIMGNSNDDVNFGTRRRSKRKRAGGGATSSKGSATDTEGKGVACSGPDPTEHIPDEILAIIFLLVDSKVRGMGGEGSGSGSGTEVGRRSLPHTRASAGWWCGINRWL